MAARFADPRCNTADAYKICQPYVHGIGCDLMYFGTREAEKYFGIVLIAFQILVAAAWVLLRLRWPLFALARLARDAPSGLRALGRASSRLVQDLITVFRTVSTQKPSLEAERVTQELERIRLRRSRIVMQRGVYLMVPVMVYGAASGLNEVILTPCSKLWHDMPQCGDVCHHTWRYLFQSEAVPMAVLGAIMVVFDTWPSLVTARSLDYSNVLLYSTWLWKLAVQTSQDYEYNKYWITPVRISHCFIFGNARLTALLHVIGFFVEDIIRQHMVDDFLMRHLRGMSRYRECLITCGALLVTWGLEAMLQAEAANVVTARTLNNAGQLVRQLLGRLCDAVVMLDGDFRITQSCPALAAMLLCDGARLVGKQVTELMPPEDAVRLHSLLAVPPQQDSGQASLTGLFHGSMSDGDSNKLPVEIFFSRLAEEDGQQMYLIGIQEQRDGETAIVPELAVRAPSVGRIAFPSNLHTLQEYAPSCSSISRGSSERSEDDNTYVWVDAADRTLPVLECSGSFAMLGGEQSPCSSLSEWMREADHRSLCEWLGKENVRGHKRVRFQPTRYWHHKCKVSLCRTREPPAAAASAVCLLVQDLTCTAASQRDLENALEDEMQRKVTSRKTGAGSPFFVWVSSDTGQVGGTTGDDTGVMKSWAKQANLSTWVEETKELSDALNDLEYDPCQEHLEESLPYKLGNFTFNRPGACGPPLRFPVKITVMRIRDDGPFPICLQFKQLKERTQCLQPGAGSTALPTPRMTI